MMDEKDRFGETMRLVERARKDIYFTQRDRELIEKLRARLQKVEEAEAELTCPRCRRKLETYNFMGIVLDRCSACGGIWMDRGELETLLKVASHGPLSSLIYRFFSKGDEAIKNEVIKKSNEWRRLVSRAPPKVRETMAFSFGPKAWIRRKSPNGGGTI